jgi:hypothetical protein
LVSVFLFGKNKMIALLDALQRCDSLRERGLEVSAYDFAAAVIHHHGHVRGLWRQQSATFEFIPAGSNAVAHTAHDLVEVVSITEMVFGPQSELMTSGQDGASRNIHAINSLKR